MNGSPHFRIAFFWMIPKFRMSWEGSSRIQQGNFQPHRLIKMKNILTSISRSPLRCGFFTVAIALCWLSLSPPLQAQCPSFCPGQGANTALGNGALDSLTTGIANTAVGSNALGSLTTGTHNTAIGASALASNSTGNFNMAIGTDALRDNTSNFNLAIGFRTLFQNTTGNHNTG